MASEISRPHLLGNFKVRSMREKHQSKNYKDRPGMSEKHCAAIRQLPCCACLVKPAGTIHHLKSGTGERGMGLRSTDRWGVPMCFAHHEDIERAGTKREVAVFGEWGIDPHELARDLWQSSPDVEKMSRIVHAHRGKR